MKKTQLKEFQIIGPEKTLYSSDLAAMAKRLRFSGKKMADIFGLTSQAKYKEIVIEKPAKEGKIDIPLDKGLSLLLRFYLAYPGMVPERRSMSLKECYEMFQRVYGGYLITEGTFGTLFGRSPGSGYRWINSGGKATSDVLMILDRFSYMKEMGMSEVEICKLWINLVRADHEVRNQEMISDGKPHLVKEFAIDKLLKPKGRTSEDDLKKREESIALNVKNKLGLIFKKYE